MKYFLIILLLANFVLFSKEKKSIYVYKVLTKNTKDPNFEFKFRNKMTAILLKDFPERNLMDDDSIAGLKAKLEKFKIIWLERGSLYAGDFQLAESFFSILSC